MSITIRRRAISGTCLLLGGVFAAYLVTWGWGSGQVFQPHMLQARLSKGLNARDVEGALAMSPGSLKLAPSSGPQAGSTASLSHPGFGACFVPQYDKALWFDRDGRLVKCLCKCVYRADDSHIPIALAKPRSNR